MNLPAVTECPRCRGIVEYVPDGLIVSTWLIGAQRTSDNPRGLIRQYAEHQTPFYACTGCEWCGVKATDSGF